LATQLIIRLIVTRTDAASMLSPTSMYWTGGSSWRFGLTD
jgi:hypothetical protein